MRKTLLIALLGTMFLALTLGAQNAPRLILAFAQDETQIVLTLPGNRTSSATLGATIPVGTRIQTNNSAVELQLQPNGTIIRLNPNTTFVVEDLQGVGGGTSNNFNLVGGRLRTVAAKVTGQPQQYSIRTPSAVGGVRGTDFAMFVGNDANGQNTDWICVQEGEVSYTNLVNGQTLAVKAGQFANALAPAFQVQTLAPEQLKAIFDTVPFQKLVPSEVPGQAQAQQPAEQAQQPASPPPAPLPTAPGPADEVAQDDDAPGSDEEDPIYKLISEILNLELGAVTIGETTYSKAILQPNIDMGTFKMGLYLPIIYTQDLFNPNDWYRPAGNYEWSFGTDASFGEDWLARIADFGIDLALKIKYLEINRPGMDPWYLKVGSLNSMTLGLGTLMRGFANDQEFPAIRRIGFNGGVDLGGLVLETVVDDLSKPQVLGGRIGIKPIGKEVPLFGSFQIGVQGITDIRPALDATDIGATGDPLFIGMAADLTLLKLDLGIFNALLFADIGSFVPYYRNTTTAYPNLPQGFATKAFFDDNQLKNFGWSTGVFGNIAIVDYRLDFRFSKGLYHPQVFSATYPRTRIEYLKQINQYLENAYAGNPNAIDDQVTTGIYGSAFANILDRAKFGLSYLWPWYFEDGKLFYSENDLFIVKFELKKNTIPVLNIWGSVSYERTKFAHTLMGWIGNGIHLFDANTIVKGEFFYPLAKGLNLVTLVSTAVVTDSNGNVVYTNDGVTPQIQPNITLEIRVNF